MKDEIKCYASPAIAALFDACPDHEICSRCGCCDQVWDSCQSCGGDGFVEMDDMDEWDDDETCVDCDGKGGWESCLGRCDKNGNHAWRSTCCDAPLYTEGSEGYRCSECEGVKQRNVMLERVEHRLNVAAHNSPFKSYESEHYRHAWEWLMIRISYPAGAERSRCYEYYLPWTPEKAR